MRFPNFIGRFWAVAALVIICAAACIHAHQLYAPADDTYIYLVYARNFLDGNGLTFNGEKVQGFTSPLWMAAITATGLAVSLPTAANALTVVSGLLVLLVAYRLGRAMGFTPAAALATPVLLAGTGDFAFYMGNGLESVGAALLLLLATRHLFFSRGSRGDNGRQPADGDARALNSWSLPLVLALATLARPEAIIIAGLVIAVLAARSRKWKAGVRCTLVMSGVLVPVFIALKLYYGDWLPNTFYAKFAPGFVNVDQGMRYLLNWSRANIAIVVSALAALVLSFRRDTRDTLPLFAMVIVWFGIVTRQGGDNMVGFRAYLPVLPLLYLATVAGLRAFAPRLVLVAALAVAGLLAFNYRDAGFVGGSFGLPINKQLNDYRYMYEHRRDVAIYLRNALSLDAVVAVNPAGVIPYFLERSTIDMLGLNNRHIAHNGTFDPDMQCAHQRGDGVYVLNQRPDIILFGGAGTARGEKFISDREISASSLFYQRYDAMHLPHGYVAYYLVGSPRVEKPPRRP